MIKDNLVKEWIIKSQNDIKSAEILYKENGPTDALCFHCHQAVEKILKGFMIFSKKEFPKTHDLIYLLNLCKKIDEGFEGVKDKASFLNRFYIETRYPPEIVVYSRQESQEVLECAQKLTQFIVNKIKLK